MSRSFKHTPICGNACCRSEKKDKRFANRAERRTVNNLLITCTDFDFLVLPIKREISDVWSFGKDGRHWFGDLRDKPPTRWRNYARMMRK